MSDSAIEIEIDLNRFTERKSNNYWDNEGKGKIHIGIRIVKYEDMKAHMGKNDFGLIKIVEEKEIILDGISFLYAKQEQNRAGKIFEMISYVKKHNENSIIEVGAIYPKGEEAKYKSIVEKAAISAKVIE